MKFKMCNDDTKSSTFFLYMDKCYRTTDFMFN